VSLKITFSQVKEPSENQPVTVKKRSALHPVDAEIKLRLPFKKNSHRRRFPTFH
jgi:hypothetical protein